MTKVVLNDLVNLENQTSVVNNINANNAVIETAFDNTISRDGSPPNQMAADLDMNSRRILNLPFPISPREPIRLEDFDLVGLIEGMNPANIPAFPATNVKTYGASGSSAAYTGSMVGNILTLSTIPDFLNGQGILVYGAGPGPSLGIPTITSVSPVGIVGGTTYSYKMASVDNSGGIGVATSAFSITNGYVTLGTYMPGVQGIARNEINWVLGSGSVLATAIWRSKNGGPYELIGCFRGTSVNDCGGVTQTVQGIPVTPPSSSTAQWLYGTVVSGQGTSTLTLSTTASASVISAVVIHDDTNAVNLALAAKSSVDFPQGTYNVRGLGIPSTVLSIKGEAGGLSVINSLSEIFGGAGVVAQGTSPLYVYGLTFTQSNPIAIGSLYIGTRDNSKIILNEFSGYIGLNLNGCTNVTVTNNTFNNWFNLAFIDQSISGSIIFDNRVNPIGAQFGAVALTATPASSVYQYGTGIWCESKESVISNNWIELRGGSFGLFSGGINNLISSNTIRFSGREAMACSGSFSKVWGNLCYWEPNGNGNRSSYDFGFSMTDPPGACVFVDITENTFICSGAAGIGIYGTNVTSISYINISNNTFFGTNQLPVTLGNISILGSNVAAVHVNNNNFINPGPGAQYLVAEGDNGFGNPNFNGVGIQGVHDAGTLGSVHLVGAGSFYLTPPVGVIGPGGY